MPNLLLGFLEQCCLPSLVCRLKLGAVDCSRCRIRVITTLDDMSVLVADFAELGLPNSENPVRLLLPAEAGGMISITVIAHWRLRDIETISSFMENLDFPSVLRKIL